MAVPKGSVTSRFPVCSRSVPSLEGPNASAERGCSRCSAFFRSASMYEWRPRRCSQRTATRNRGTVGTRNRVKGLQMEHTRHGMWNNWPLLPETARPRRGADCQRHCISASCLYTGLYKVRVICYRDDRAVQQLLDRKFSRKFQAIEKVSHARLPVFGCSNIASESESSGSPPGGPLKP